MVTTHFSATVLKNAFIGNSRGEHGRCIFSMVGDSAWTSILDSCNAFWSVFGPVSCSLSQLLFLQESATWGEYTGAAIGVLVAAATGLIFVTPEFLVFKGHVSTLDELYEIRSTRNKATTLRRRSLCCSAWCGYEERWNAFLQERGLRR